MKAWHRRHFFCMLYNKIVPYRSNKAVSVVWIHLGLQNGFTRKRKEPAYYSKEHALPVLLSYEQPSASWSGVKVCTTVTPGQ